MTSPRTIATHRPLAQAMTVAKSPKLLAGLAMLAGLACAPLACSSPPAELPGPIHHEIAAELDPGAGTIAASDRLTLPPGDWVLTLHRGLNPKVDSGDATLQPLGRDDHLEHYRLHVAGAGPVALSYAGVIRHGLEDVAESLGRGHQRTRGTIGEDGVFLDGSSGWYPSFGDHLHTFTLEVRLPPGWLAVSQGAGPGTLTEPSEGTGASPRQARASWREDQPQNEIDLVAAPFTLYQRATPVAQAEVYLRTADPGLADRYLEATETYLDLYSRLIGPYPYPKFALVENFWETGYGMPSFTLLGPQVIRLPFIIDTSYPHEILHNWWGNGVYVDYASGNWSEGLTAYLADHLLAERRGAGADYRRDALRAYADYVRQDGDFPLREFRSRHSSASQAIGYGKALMVFHMLRRQLGDQTFVEGLRRFYADNRFRTARYEDLRRAFEAVSGRDLQGFFAAWTGRTGLPRLQIADLMLRQGSQGFRLTGRVDQTQAEDPFPLEVPLLIELADGELREERIPLTERSATFDLELPAAPIRLSADPDFDLFRVLADGESPVTLSRVFGAQRGVIVWPSEAPPELAQAYRTLANAWAASYPGWDVRSDRDLDGLPKGSAVWLLGWENRHLSTFVAGATFRLDPKDHRLGIPSVEAMPEGALSPVLTRSIGAQPVAWLATPEPAAVAGLARKLPHYGKYSYLAFTGSGPGVRLKGQWPAGDSELTVWMTEDRVPPKRLQRPPLADQAR